MGNSGVLKTRDISAEQFKAQFTEAPREVLVKIQWSWERGCSDFSKLDGLYLAHANYAVPFEDNEKSPFPPGGQIYWLCRKKTFGYRYEHNFARNKYYRLKVRFFPDTRFCFLESIVEADVDIEKIDEIYNSVLKKYLSRFSEETEVITVYPEKRLGNPNQKFGDIISSAKYPFITCANEDGKVKNISGMLYVPCDNRDLREMKSVSLKPETLCKLRVRKPAEGSYGFLVESVIEANVNNKELEAAAKAASASVNIYLGDLGELKRTRRYDEMFFEGVLTRNGEELFSVSLEADPEAPASADAALAKLNEILADIEGFRAKVFGAVADDVINDDGLVCTWEYEDGEDEFSHALTREQFIARLSLAIVEIEHGGEITIYVDLDEMFTDHSYMVWIDENGNIDHASLVG